MDISFSQDGYDIGLASSPDELLAAQRLRYDVFVRELGGTGDGADHGAGEERDRFDAHADHMLLRTQDTHDIVGVYRMMRPSHALRAGGYYCETEFDLAPLLSSGRGLMELGRSCVAPSHRNGPALFHLWTGLSHYVKAHGIDLMFGVASLPGNNPDRHAGPLSVLHHNHLAPPHLRARSRVFAAMDLVSPDNLDRKAAMVAMPPLIKAYLRLGGRVGEGAFVDHAFNCTDVCMIMDTHHLNARHAERYRGRQA